MKTLLAFLLLFVAAPARALDAACTTTTNLGMARCPENSEDWYESYTDQVDELDALARTAKSTFTVAGDDLGVGRAGTGFRFKVEAGTVTAARYIAVAAVVTYVQASSITLTSGATVYGSLTLRGTDGQVTVVGGSVTANAFFGNGSALTGVGEANTYGNGGSTKTFNSTVQMSSAVIVYIEASSATLTNGGTFYGTLNVKNTAIVSTKLIVGLQTMAGDVTIKPTTNNIEAMVIMSRTDGNPKVKHGVGGGSGNFGFVDLYNSAQVNTVRLNSDDTDESWIRSRLAVGLPAASSTSTLHVGGTGASIIGALNIGNGKLKVASGGNVGIGTTGDASTKLHLSSGTLTVDGTDGQIKVLGGSVTASGFFGNGSGLTGLSVSGSGLLRQFVSSMTTGSYTVSAIIPDDNTIPQISEGIQILVATMTPTNATSNIRIEGHLNIAEQTNGAGFAVVCIFQGTTADALACALGVTAEATASATEQVRFDYVLSAVNTTERNYSVRLGSLDGTPFSTNTGRFGAARFGQKLTSVLRLSEIAP